MLLVTSRSLNMTTEVYFYDTDSFRSIQRVLSLTTRFQTYGRVVTVHVNDQPLCSGRCVSLITRSSIITETPQVCSFLIHLLPLVPITFTFVVMYYSRYGIWLVMMYKHKIDNFILQNRKPEQIIYIC